MSPCISCLTSLIRPPQKRFTFVLFLWKLSFNRINQGEENQRRRWWEKEKNEKWQGKSSLITHREGLYLCSFIDLASVRTAGSIKLRLNSPYSLTFQIRHIRRKNNIHVYGSDAPEPVETFEQLREDYNVHQQIVTNLFNAGFRRPTPIQMQAVPVMLQVSFHYAD